jgi:heme A synthase
MSAPERRRTFQVLALAAALSTYATMVLGGFVKSTGAGLACPDWPLCHGEVIPDLTNPLIASEWAHRLVAAVTSALIVALLVTARAWMRGDPWIVRIAATAVSILAGQVTLGMLTVASELDPVVVTMHLALAIATFGAVLAITIQSFKASPPQAREGRVPSEALLD